MVNTITIKEWVKRNRPDLVEYIDEIYNTHPTGHILAMQLLLAIGFEAGQNYKENT